MTKMFTTLQLFSLTDGRLATSIGDVYEMLNHITDDDLMTHHLPVAMDYLRAKNPKWYQEQKAILQDIIAKEYHKPGLIASYECAPDCHRVNFDVFVKVIKEKYNKQVEVPRLKDEFDTSDFVSYMLNNSLLLRKLGF